MAYLPGRKNALSSLSRFLFSRTGQENSLVAPLWLLSSLDGPRRASTGESLVPESGSTRPELSERQLSSCAASGSSASTSLRTWNSHYPRELADEGFPANRQSFSHYGLAATCDPSHHYEIVTINVVTGKLRGAGTTSKAYIQLVGSDGISPSIPLTNPGEDHQGYERGTTKSFTVCMPRHIGRLLRVVVEKEPDTSEQADGWYLEHVDVLTESGEAFMFHCNAWLGACFSGDGSGPLTMSLVPTATAIFCPLHQRPELEKPTPVSMAISGMAIPHPDKVKKGGMKGVNRQFYGFGGEDAYFYCYGSTHCGMGVADGVFAWKEHGIDPGQFSKALMDTCRKMIEAGMDDAFQVLQAASHHVIDEGFQGSAPVCLLTVNEMNGLLHSINLGDSGYLVFGPDPEQGSNDWSPTPLILKHRTSQQEFEFGHPFQIGHHDMSNRPEDGELACFRVVPGDIIVMGSDGLLDNVSEMEMALELSRLQKKRSSPSQMVQSLTKMAFEASIDKRRATPYSQGASDFFQMVYSGGKKDDITVLVAVVGNKG